MGVTRFWYTMGNFLNLYRNDVNRVDEEVFEEENVTYKTYCELLRKEQLRTLTAIAKEHKVRLSTSSGLAKYKTLPHQLALSVSEIICRQVVNNY